MVFGDSILFCIKAADQYVGVPVLLLFKQLHDFTRKRKEKSFAVRVDVKQKLILCLWGKIQEV